MDEQWGYVGAKSRQRWLFYAYDRLRKTVVAHVFGERTMATLGRLMSLLSPFDVVIWGCKPEPPKFPSRQFHPSHKGIQINHLAVTLKGVMPVQQNVSPGYRRYLGEYR